MYTHKDFHSNHASSRKYVNLSSMWFNKQRSASVKLRGYTVHQKYPAL